MFSFKASNVFYTSGHGGPGGICGGIGTNSRIHPAVRLKGRTFGSFSTIINLDYVNMVNIYLKIIKNKNVKLKDARMKLQKILVKLEGEIKKIKE